MPYQVIARKYRPQRFADVVGQEHVTTTLANAIGSGRIAHAYLFCGPRGTGKTTLARIFAKCLNCTGGPSVDFADNDPKAQEIAEGRALDVMEIDGASNNGVEQVRELRDTVKFAPASSKFKIYIIDEVHMLTTAAFNALLKTLEEPPAHVKFLFATTDPEKVLPTILSRCQRFDLRRIPAALITRHLGEIAVKEGVGIDQAALYAIARGADGGMRDAQSTLDQLISFCGTTITEADVLSMFGLADRAQLRELAGATARGDAADALRLLDGFARSGKDLARLLADLLGHFRNLLIFQISKGERTLLEVGDEEFAQLGEQAKLADVDTLTRMVEVLSAAEGRLRDSASKRIFVEVTLLKAIQARNSLGLDGVLRQLRSLRDESSAPPSASIPAGTGAGAVIPSAPNFTTAPPTKPRSSPSATAPLPVAPAAAPVSAVSVTPAAAPGGPIPAPAPAPAPNAAATANTAEESWAALFSALTPADVMLRTSLEQCQPVSLVRGVLTLSHAEDVLIETNRNIATIKARLLAATGQTFNIRFVAETAPKAPIPNPAPAAATAPPPKAAPKPVEPKADAPRPPPAPVVFSKEDFLNDPLIRQALEIFKGRIIEIRPEG